MKFRKQILPPTVAAESANIFSIPRAAGRWFTPIFALLVPLTAHCVSLVKEGAATAEIIVPESASPSVKMAAEQLQFHLQKISGAKLSVVHTPTEGITNHVYVGKSPLTEALGVTLDGIKDDGFKIVAKDNFVALVGREFYRAPILGKFDNKTRTSDWQEMTGYKWRFPAFHDFRTFSKTYGFYVVDGTGTLSAVYELLEQLGWRYFLPIEDIGIVYPELKTVEIEPQDRIFNPQFPIREWEPINGKFDHEFVWWKSMRIGSSFIYPQEHSLGSVLKFGEEQPVEYFGTLNGRLMYVIPRLLNEKLREEHATYLNEVLKAMPELEYVSITPQDGWGDMDDTDKAAGWDKEAERGPRGRFSDYYWDHVMNVRERVLKKHPKMKFIVYAYAGFFLPPTKPEKIPDDITVAYCQNTTQFMMPLIQNQLAVRDEWLERLGPDRMFIYDYYYEHAPGRGFPPLPVIFTKYMEDSFRGTYDRTGLGTFVCIPWDYESELAVLRRPGLTHLMIYLHNRFLWDANLDLPAVLDDYYSKFYGPAKAEMKEFFEFSESVWTRPGAREISVSGGFLKEADVSKYFEILGRAKVAAGDTIYGKRIDLITSEMEPLKILFENLQRTGEPVSGFRTKEALTLDGDLSEPFWTERKDSFVVLRDMITGETPTHVETRASVRWVADGSKLVIGIECFEPRMNNLSASADGRDSRSIFKDDNVEIRLETPDGLRPFIVVNSNGTVLDECASTNAAELPQFYTIENVAVRKSADQWSVEVVIDAKKLNAEMPSKTFPWGIAINRQRMAGNTPEHYMITPSGKDFQDISNLGNLNIR